MIIEAIQLSKENWSQVAEWCNGTAPPTNPPWHKVSDLWIHNLGYITQASIGDWIIKDNKGEFDCCKPNIFEATYESV